MLEIICLTKQALHLPSMLTVKAVYGRMQLDLGQTVSQAQFYKLWNQHFPHVTIPPVSYTAYQETGDQLLVYYKEHFKIFSITLNYMQLETLPQGTPGNNIGTLISHHYLVSFPLYTTPLLPLLCVWYI